MDELKVNTVYMRQDRIMASWTFDQSILDEQKLKIGRKYVERGPDVREKNLGLLLWGKVGTGKTYFAEAIANALLQSEGSSGAYD